MEMLNCSFKPVINKNFKNIQPFYSNQNVDKSLKFIYEQKNLKELIIQKEKEFLELKECTFKPEV